MSTHIESCWEPGGESLAARSVAEVKREPMLFSCDLAHAHEFGGPITEEFLDKVFRAWPEFAHLTGVVIDTRVHMLMPGFYPAIPGWHHDDVPRTGPPNSAGVPQPDYRTPAGTAEHVAGIVTAGQGLSLTEYALGDALFTDPPEGATVYQHWADEVEFYIAGGLLDRVGSEDGELVRFDDRTWHRAMPASAPCWRWFCRISRGTDRAPANEVRTQVQAYIVTEEQGW